MFFNKKRIQGKKTLVHFVSSTYHSATSDKTLCAKKNNLCSGNFVGNNKSCPNIVSLLLVLLQTKQVKRKKDKNPITEATKNEKERMELCTYCCSVDSSTDRMMRYKRKLKQWCVCVEWSREKGVQFQVICCVCVFFLSLSGKI